MKTRQFVWTHPEVLAYAKKNFVVVASDDVKYRETADRNSREWKVLSAGTAGLAQQGMYALSSAGKPLGYLNRGWPDPDPKAVLQEMQNAVAKYQALPRDQRLASVPFQPADRSRFEEDAFTKPVGTLNLRIVSRGLPFAGMTSYDQRHPMYFHMDRLWFRPSEWKAFLPARLVEGAQVQVTGPARNRMVLLSHHQAGESAWWEEHIVGGKTVSRVEKVNGDLVFLRIEGDYTMRADTQWCKDTYDGKVLAKAVFDQRRQAFTRFDLAMLGTHKVGVRMEHLHQGDLTARIAVTAQLNPLLTSSDRMRPHNWKYGYTLNWCR